MNEQRLLRFTNRSVVITGAGSGLGRATADRIAVEGGNLVLVDRDEAAAETTRLALPRPDNAIVIQADVSRPKEVAHYVSESVARFGSIHGFFNNAGVEGASAETDAYDDENFARVLDINLSGAFYGLKSVLGVMRSQGFGRVVNMASLAGIRGGGGMAGYTASKHGVVGLTRNAAAEFGHLGITVNAIAPGGILTPMVERGLRAYNPDDLEAAERHFADGTPMKRLGRPSEIASAAAFLLSDDASYVNSIVLSVDGGTAFTV